MPSVIAMGTGAAARIDVTIVMPCLNEAKWLPACIANAKEALTRIRAEIGLVVKSSSPTTAARTGAN
jgi:glycosyltransferase involved in cell wall biosynthesis